MRCPKGHVGPFEPILIGFPRPRKAEWWLQCRSIDEECRDCSCWCDERFPRPKTQELLSLLVDPEIHTELVKRFPDGFVLRQNRRWILADYLRN